MSTDEPTSEQHRIYLGPPRPGLAMDDIQRHWIEKHSEIVKDMPRLGGYVQNRPVAGSLRESPFAVCAETWFASRGDERASFGSEYFRDVISPDERDHLIDQEASWNSAVERTELLVEGDRSAVRLLVFGADRWAGPSSPQAGRIEVLRLRRSAPFDAGPAVLSAWFDDEAEAERIRGRYDRLALVTRPAAVVAPPGEWP